MNIKAIVKLAKSSVEFRGFKMWFKGISFVLALASTFGSPLGEFHDQNEVVESKFGVIDDNFISPFVDEVPTTFRLPNDSLPLKYSLTLLTDVDKTNFDFNGRVEIHIRVIEPTSVITLHYKEIVINKIELRTAENLVFLRDLDFYEISSHDFLKINLTTVSQVGEEFVLDIQYSGVLRSDGAGFYRAYYDVNGTRVWYGTTQFEVTDARHAMPCYDEPGIRAPIQLTMVHSPTYKAISNAPVDRIEPFGAYQRTIFEPTPSMQTYLLAFIVSPFEYVSNNDARVEQRIYAKPSSIRNGEGDFSVAVVKSMLEKFEDHLKVEFPIRKMDHAAITQFNFGAMENFGLITYTESGLLYNPNTSWINQEVRQMSIVRLIAHEYAHQWFGNIVSPQWWTYTWLNEGFATLFESYISSLIYPNLNYMNRFITNNLPRAFANDVGSSWSMNHYTEVPAQLWNKFGAIGYSKSGCVLRMFQESLTASTFAKGLNYYLTDNFMKAVTPEHLHVALQRAYNEDFPGNSVDIEMLMSSWENQAGYPLVSVEIAGSNLVFTQRRYPTSNGEIYAIPLTFATLNDHRFSVTTPKAWLATESMTMSMSSANFNISNWIVLNNQQVGYYRVDYSTELWHAIIKQLNENHQIIHPINRAILQDEIYMAFNDLDRLNITDVLECLRYLSVEDEPLAWSRADKFLSELNIRLLGTHTHSDFRRFVRDITKPHLAKLGFEAIEGEPSHHTSLRSSVKKWSCTVWDDECLDNEYQKWWKFFTTNNAEVPFDFCFALTTLDLEMFDEILTGVTTDVNYPSRNNYLRYLGCNQNTTNLNALLSTTIEMDNILTTEERISLMLSVFQAGYKGTQAYLYFVDVFFAEIRAVDYDAYVPALVELAKYTSSECSLISLALLEAHSILFGFLTFADLVPVNAVKNVAIDWNAKNFADVRNWFDFSYTEPVTESTSTSSTTGLSSTSSTSQDTTEASSSILMPLNVLIVCFLLSLKLS